MENKLNYNNLKYFYEVVKYESFTNASNALLVSQPALSYSIKKLEEELGQKLIIRNSKKIELTSEGLALFNKLNAVKSILFDDEKSQEKIAIGVIRVFADNFLEKAIYKFKQKYPGCNLEIFVSESRNLLSNFTNCNLNLIIDKYPYEESSKYQTSIKLLDMENCFACSKTFFEKNSQMLNDLSCFSNWPIILPNKSNKRRQLETFLSEHNLVPTVSLEVPHSQLLLNLVKNQNYIGYFIRQSVKDELDNNSLVEIKSVPDLPVTSFYATYNLNRASKQLLYFIEMLK